MKTSVRFCGPATTIQRNKIMKTLFVFATVFTAAVMLATGKAGSYSQPGASACPGCTNKVSVASCPGCTNKIALDLTACPGCTNKLVVDLASCPGCTNKLAVNLFSFNSLGDRVF
jgi:hypothetical protein